MTDRTTAAFWALYDALPRAVRMLADKNYALYRDDPQHPSLHFKPVGRYWSIRVGKSHRAVAVRRGDDLIWFWIGKHGGYDKLLK